MTTPMKVEQIAEMFDSTALHVTITKEELKKLCEDAVNYGFKTVAVNHWAVPICREILLDSGVGITTTVSYPLGTNLLEEKIMEAEFMARQGPTDLDYVINIAELKAGNYSYMEEEMYEITKVCRKHGLICKVILETYHLTDAEIIKMCQIATRVRPDFIKTSTGQIKGGGAVDRQVQLIASTLKGSQVGIKPSGGIRTIDSVLQMIQLGATRFGTSNAVNIINEHRAKFN